MAQLRRFALLAAALAGCGSGSGPGGPSVGADGGVVGPAGSGATIQFVLAAGGYVGHLPAATGGNSVESVAFWIDNLSLSGDRGGSDYGNGGFEGMLLDLTNGPVSFDLPGAAPALYSRMRVDFKESGDHAHPAAFQGMSLSYRVAGKTAAGDPFVLGGRDDFSLDLRVVDGAELGARTKLLCVVRLDMNAWWNGVTLSGSGGSGGGGGSSGGGGSGGEGDGHGGDGSGGAFLDNVSGSASMTLSAVAR